MFSNVLDGPAEQPDVTAADVRDWLDTQIAKGARHSRRLQAQFDAERDGDIPEGTYEPDVHRDVLRLTALAAKTRELLNGVLGTAPGQPSQEDVDREFFSLIGFVHNGWRDDRG